MPKRKQESDGGIPEWVVTYGDLMSLLLCFFILLAAFSELKQEREYRKVLESVREALGFKGGMGIANIDDNAANAVHSLQEERARRSEDKLQTNVNWDPSVPGRHERSQVVNEGQLLAIGGAVPFEAGSIELTRPAKEILRTAIGPKIRDQNFVVQIVGHAWGEEEKRSGFGIDEIAFHRAQAVKDYLVRECGIDPLILRVVSAGSTEPASLGSSSVELPGTNRRVQVWQTGRTVEQTHPDPNYTGG